MSATSMCTRVVVTGPDTPGITAAMSGVLADASVALVDVEQVVLHGHLTLALQLGLDPEDGRTPAIVERLGATAAPMGLAVTQHVPTVPDPRPRTPYAITALGNPIEPRHVQRVAGVLAAHDANITAISRLSDAAASAPPHGLSALEIRAELSIDDPAVLRHALLELALADGLDLAVQREGLVRRAKRLVVMDMDSTLIQVEVIDELARAHGVAEQVEQLTKDAMGGRLDYEESLRRRVAMLEGLAWDKVVAIAENLPLTEGAESLVMVLRRLGYRTAVISGGFDVAANRVAARLGLDHAHSNQLEVVEGCLTGRVTPPVVTPQRKAALLRSIANEAGIPLEQTIAIGDGANDLLMLETAGLGVAFHAKSTLQRAADTALSNGGLDRVLFLLGLHERETRELMATPEGLSA